MEKIRPTISVEDATSLRDIIKKVVVFDMVKSNFLLSEESQSLRDFEEKLTELIMLAETRSLIKQVKASRATEEP